MLLSNNLNSETINTHTHTHKSEIQLILTTNKINKYSILETCGKKEQEDSVNKITFAK